jgi:hypothetical protein
MFTQVPRILVFRDRIESVRQQQPIPEADSVHRLTERFQELVGRHRTAREAEPPGPAVLVKLDGHRGGSLLGAD